MEKDLVLVIGASGTVGSEILNELRSEGYRVRAATSQQPKHKEQVQVNLVTGEGIKAALEGVDRAFFMSPPGHSDQYKILSPLIQEAKRRGLKKVVLMTAMGANANDASPFRRAEVELEKSGLSYNIIRPNWFYQNFNTFWIQGIREQKKILLPAGTAKVSFIDARDISAVAAKLLTSSDLLNQAFDLTGSQAVDHDEVVKAISNASGQQIVYEEITPVALQKSLLSVGLPQDYVEFLIMIVGYLREGYNAGINDNIKNILGTSPKTLERYANDYKQSWI